MSKNDLRTLRRELCQAKLHEILGELPEAKRKSALRMIELLQLQDVLGGKEGKGTGLQGQCPGAVPFDPILALANFSLEPQGNCEGPIHIDGIR